MRRMSRYVALALVAAALLTLPRSEAATPAAGEVSATSPVVQWTGAPCLAANPTVDTDCAVPQAPFCDTFVLTIGVLPEARPDVVVSVKGASDADIVNVAVYDAAGTKVAEAGA